MCSVASSFGHLHVKIFSLHISVSNIDVKELTHVKFGTIFCSEATLQDKRQVFYSLKHEEGRKSSTEHDG